MLRSPTLILLALVCLAGCDDPTGPSLPERARLVALEAPESLPTTVALTVHVTFELGRCDRLLRVQGMTRDGVLEIEVLKRYDLPPGSGGCPDIGPFELTVALQYPPRPAGTLTVRGLQPEPLVPLERTVVIQPE